MQKMFSKNVLSYPDILVPYEGLLTPVTYNVWMYAIKITAFLFHSMCIFLLIVKALNNEMLYQQTWYIGPIWAIYVGLPTEQLISWHMLDNL